MWRFEDLSFVANLSFLKGLGEGYMKACNTLQIDKQAQTIVPALAKVVVRFIFVFFFFFLLSSLGFILVTIYYSLAP